VLLYGQTTLVYHALKAGVVVSLGTDWSPSGSHNLLNELKVADITLRDARLLGRDRDLIPALSISGKGADARQTAEIALDKLMVQMVTTNPAKSVRWSKEVGSIEAGKFADLLVIGKPDHVSAPNLPDSPYRNLIDSTEKDVQLVLVNGEPVSGEVSIMNRLKPDDYEVITSTDGCFQKAIDVTSPTVTLGIETYSQVQQLLRDGLTALGGDHPPAGGGPADDSNTYSYLKANIPGASGLPDFFFLQLLKTFLGVTSTGRLNLERIQLAPVLVEDDDFYFHLIGADVSPMTGLIEDDSPPFGLYPSNFNQIQPGGNPFATDAYRNRYFSFCSQSFSSQSRYANE
jgi:hypothetical protein